MVHANTLPGSLPRTPPAARKRVGYWADGATTVGWVFLIVLGGFFLFAPLSDLVADFRTGIPADHLATFSAVSGVTWASISQGAAGLAAYVTTLEVAYAVHELVFGLLFLAIVTIPLRRGERWAWWACWAVMPANITYWLTFGQHDPAIFRQSLIAVIALPLLLLTQVPRLHRQAAAVEEVA